MREKLIELLAGRRGHFQMESGYHAEMWYDLDRLFQSAEALRPFVAELATRLATHGIDAVCGPMVGGAKLAEEIAGRLQIETFVTERRESPTSTRLFPVRYLLGEAQRSRVKGKRIAIVDDAISAGSAVRGTLADLQRCEAEIVVIGSLFIFGESAERWAKSENLVIETVAKLPFEIWAPANCPLCQRGLACENVTDASPPRG